MEARDFVVDLQGWGLTQAEIAEKTGIPQPTISKIYRGDVKDVLSQKYRELQRLHESEAHKRAQEQQPAVPFAALPPAVQRAIAGEGGCS